MSIIHYPLSILSFFCASATAFAQTELYVSPTGKDSNDGLTAQTPLRSFSQVLGRITPGTTVYLMPGQYTSGLTLKPEHSGTEGQYVTFCAYDPADRPKLHYGGNNQWNCIDIQASYTIIDGLELEGYNQQFDLTEARTDSLAAYEYSRRYHEQGGSGFDWSGCAKYNTNGISIGKGGKEGGFPHHVTVRNCRVHDFPGSGIGSQQADWLTLQDNEVYNCAWYCMYACSGISILTPYNSDDEDQAYKMQVIGNTVYNNHTKIPWCTSSHFRLSDGNGIIIDVNLTPDHSSTPEIKADGAYRGKTLVANNVSYFNGGSGIHAFKAAQVDIINNTTYCNEQRYDGEYGEIFSQSGRDNHIVNNIMYARPDHKCNNYVSNGGGTYEHNLYYGGLYTRSATDTYGDPAFVRQPTLSALAGDFHLQPGSPAIGLGLYTPYMPLTDKDGVTRGPLIDAGAYCADPSAALPLPQADAAPTSVAYTLWGTPVDAISLPIVKGVKVKHGTAIMTSHGLVIN